MPTQRQKQLTAAEYCLWLFGNIGKCLSIQVNAQQEHQHNENGHHNPYRIHKQNFFQSFYCTCKSKTNIRFHQIEKQLLNGKWPVFRKTHLFEAHFYRKTHLFRCKIYRKTHLFIENALYLCLKMM